jgi:hypothetical protein
MHSHEALSYKFASSKWIVTRPYHTNLQLVNTFLQIVRCSHSHEALSYKITNLVNGFIVIIVTIWSLQQNSYQCHEDARLEHGPLQSDWRSSTNASRRSFMALGTLPFFLSKLTAFELRASAILTAMILVWILYDACPVNKTLN